MIIIHNSQRKEQTPILGILGFLMYLDFMYFYLKYMGVLPEYMSMHHMCGVYEESRSGPWIFYSTETSFVCWEWTLGSLEEQGVFLTNGSSLQRPKIF